MAKPEWGTKRTCHNCGAKFYDLRRDPVTCPVCDTVQDPGRHPKPRRGGPKAEPVEATEAVEDEVAAETKPDATAAEGADEDVEDVTDGDKTGDDSELNEIDSEDEDLIEDTSDLGEDDDDIGEVIEHIDEDLEDKT